MGALRVLLLGGTGEAAELAAQLSGDNRFRATLSLAGVTRAPALPPIGHRIGGFGGVAGLSAFLRHEAVAAVVDATHPYAVRISRHAEAAAAETGTLLLRIERPAWTAGPGDRWIHVRDAQAAAAALGAEPRRVLLTLGTKSLAPFRAAPGHHYVVRCIDPPDPALLPPGAALMLARGPFTLAAELTLLRQRRIELLVSKNSGGDATAPKLLAARLLGRPVVMIDRPPGASGTCTVETADAARRWLERVHGREPLPAGSALGTGCVEP